jgi:FtsZ-binding cell division protein ZapB
MGTMSMNIDDLLEETVDIAEDVISFALNQVEIDSLLENTRHW